MQNNQNNKPKMPTPDAMINTKSLQQGDFGINVAQILKAENRGPNSQGQPYKSDRITFNVKHLVQCIEDGTIKVSASGFASLDFMWLTPEAKSKMANSRGGNGGGQQGQVGGNNSKQQGQPWNQQNNQGNQQHQQDSGGGGQQGQAWNNQQNNQQGGGQNGWNGNKGKSAF